MSLEAQVRGRLAQLREEGSRNTLAGSCTLYGTLLHPDEPQSMSLVYLEDAEKSREAFEREERRQHTEAEWKREERKRHGKER